MKKPFRPHAPRDRRPSRRPEPKREQEVAPLTEIGPNTSTFEELGLPDTILRGVREAGFETPSPIQQAAIPIVLAGNDMIGQAQTGSGKTAAWGLAAMACLRQDRTVEILVLTPTRELAGQVADELTRLGRFTGAKPARIVGGESFERQIESINRGANIVVATPGRVLDHMRENRLRGMKPHIVVLDEADEMLDMGFLEDIRAILALLPAERQTLLFSATMPPPIAKLAREFLREPKHVRLSHGHEGVETVEQRLYLVRDDERMDALARVLDVEDPEKAIVFCRMKRDVDDVAQALAARGFPARAIHGDLAQSQRQQTLQALKMGHTRIIVATDVAARGLDIQGLTHVINFHAPDNRSRYVHRIGRTGRAGAKGIAITFVSKREIHANSSFDRRYARDFVPCSVPSRADAIARKGSRLVASVREATLVPDWKPLCEDLLAGDAAIDVVTRMFSMLMGQRRVTGPDVIGDPAGETRKFLSRGGVRAPRDDESFRTFKRSRRPGR